MKDESLQLFSCIHRWASTDRLKLPCPGTHESPFSQHCPPRKGTSSCRSCPALPSARLNTTLGCTKRSAGLPPEQRRLLPCQPGDLCCLHPPAQTGLKLAIIWVCALIPSDCHYLLSFFGFLVGQGRRGKSAHSPEE